MPVDAPATASQPQVIDLTVGGGPLPQQLDLQSIFENYCDATPEVAKDIAETLGLETGCKTAIDYHIYFNGLAAPPDRGSKEVDRYMNHVANRKANWKNNGPILILP